jgi:hypothetical protein
MKTFEKTITAIAILSALSVLIGMFGCLVFEKDAFHKLWAAGLSGLIFVAVIVIIWFSYDEFFNT